MNLHHELSQESGFNLFEIMAVICILGILASMTVPKFDLLRKSAIEVQAKIAVSEIYKLEEIHYLFAGYYSPCLRQLGYEPVSKNLEQYYTVGFESNSLYGIKPVYGEGGAGTCKNVNAQAGDPASTSDTNFAANTSARSGVAPADFKSQGSIVSKNGFNYFSSIGKFKNGKSFFYVGAVGTKPISTVAKLFGGGADATQIYDAWSYNEKRQFQHLIGNKSKQFQPINTY